MSFMIEQQCMNTWFTSDTHFGHKNIIRYSGRPFSSAEEMDEALVANWNKIVRPSDTVYHLGDIAFSKGKVHPALFKLNGKIRYLRGNHSRGLRVPPDWTCLGDYYEFDYRCYRFVLNHYSQRVWNKAHYGTIHLFSHSHGELPPWGRSVDVGVDSPWLTSTKEYRPFSIEEIISWAANQSLLQHHDRD